MKTFIKLLAIVGGYYLIQWIAGLVIGFIWSYGIVGDDVLAMGAIVFTIGWIPVVIFGIVTLIKGIKRAHAA